MVIFSKIILLLLTKLIQINSVLVSPQYNKGEFRDPLLDMYYFDNPGINLYFLSYDVENTMFNVVLNQKEEALEVNFKIYTDSETVEEALDYGLKSYFGFDFNIENKNKSLQRYKTDIIICSFDKKDVNCSDYVYDKENNKYIKNENSIISPNYIIPLGFENETLNIIDKQVIRHNNYFGIKFYKKFKKPNEKETLFKWVNDKLKNINHEVFGFYGVTVWEDDDLNQFSQKFPIFYKKIIFENGAGLKSGKIQNFILNEITLSFIKCALIFYVAFFEVDN
jgi:hypothetical protein